MKKSLLLTAVLLIVSLMSMSAQVKFGAGLALGTKAGINSSGNEAMALGLNVRADYALSSIDLSGGFTYFIPSKATVLGMDLTAKASQLNLDAHYNLSKSENMKIYGLAGLNLSFATAEVSGMGVTESASDSKVGLDLGVGATMSSFFGELKYDTTFKQIAVAVGYHF